MILVITKAFLSDTDLNVHHKYRVEKQVLPLATDNECYLTLRNISEVHVTYRKMSVNSSPVTIYLRTDDDDVLLDQ